MIFFGKLLIQTLSFRFSASYYTVCWCLPSDTWLHFEELCLCLPVYIDLLWLLSPCHGLCPLHINYLHITTDKLTALQRANAQAQCDTVSVCMLSTAAVFAGKIFDSHHWSFESMSFLLPSHYTLFDKMPEQRRINRMFRASGKL